MNALWTPEADCAAMAAKAVSCVMDGSFLDPEGWVATHWADPAGAYGHLGDTGTYLYHLTADEDGVRAEVAGDYYSTAYAVARRFPNGEMRLTGETVSRHAYRVEVAEGETVVDLPDDGSRVFRPAALVSALLAGCRFADDRQAWDARRFALREAVAADRRIRAGYASPTEGEYAARCRAAVGALDRTRHHAK